LQPEIEKRNRIAHGQWIIAFNNVLSDFSSEITKELNKDNYILLIQKLDIFKEIAFMINNLVASTLKKQFKNNFDEYYMKLNM
ncbi:MAG TPA: hypothetical protein DG753_13685, partial [Clostridium sp.]|nr:hypothetical protein [Clostridium sp.]